MEWFFFFKDGKPQMVRFAATRGHAIEQLECCWGHRWGEFEAEGYTCMREFDVDSEVWESLCEKKACTYQDELDTQHKERMTEYRKKVHTSLLREQHVMALRHAAPPQEIRHRKNAKTMCDMHLPADEIIVQRAVTCQDFCLEEEPVKPPKLETAKYIERWTMTEAEKAEIMKGFE